MIYDRQNISRLRKPLRTAEPRPMLTHVEARRVLDSIERSEVSDVQAHALVSLMFLNHLRLSRALGLECGDLIWEGSHLHLLIPKRMARQQDDKFALTCFPEVQQALIDYIGKANLVVSDLKLRFFRTVDRATGKITSQPLSAQAAHIAINRLARRAGIERDIWLHEFRIAGASLLKQPL